MINKYKLLFTVVVLIFSAISISSFISYDIAVNLTKDELTNKTLPLSSDNIYSEIQRDLLKPNLVSSLMANDTFLKSWIKNGEKDISEIKKYLLTIQKKYNTSISFLVSDNTRAYYYSKGLLKYVNASNKRDIWFFRIKNSAYDYESNIDLSLANNDAMTIFTNYKILDKDGEFLGVTGVGLKVKAVSDFLANYKKKYKHDIYFVDNKSNIVLSTIEEKILEKKKELIASILKKASLDGKESMDYILNGEKYYINTRFIDELNLFVFVEAKEKELIQKLKNSFYLEISITILISIIIFVLVAYVINSFQKKLEEMAKYDNLTTLLNRNMFEHIFNKKFLAKKPLSIVLLDIDDFKSINDKFGHKAGDKVLIELSKVLKTTFRKNDTIARWGGEEFIILISNIEKEKLNYLAEAIRNNIEQSKIISNLINKKLTVSVAVATCLRNENQEEFFIRADKYLYKAKNSGKNMVVTD